MKIPEDLNDQYTESRLEWKHSQIDTAKFLSTSQLIERIAKAEQDVAALQQQLAAMTTDRNLWRDADEEGGCPNIGAAKQIDALQRANEALVEALTKGQSVHAVKCWLYPRLTRFAKPPYNVGRFNNSLASAYKEYDKITANSEKGLPVFFVDEAQIFGLTFAEVCDWIAEYATLQACAVLAGQDAASEK